MLFYSGQLGDGTTTERATPVATTSFGMNISMVAVANGFSMFLSLDNTTLFATGINVCLLS